MKCLFSILLVGCASGHDFGGTDAAVTPETSTDGDGTSNACTLGYPAGPYGTGVGKVVNPGFTWQGYLPGATTVTTVTPNDVFDCDGSKGINALVFDVAASWCAACQSQAANQNQLSSQEEALGIHVVTLVVQDSSMAPATTATAQSWKDQYTLTGVTVCADPSFSFAPLNQSQVQLPVTVIVDPRTMRIMKVEQGYVAAYPLAPDAEAVSIAKKNGG
jgi:hypothetical protein